MASFSVSFHFLSRHRVQLCLSTRAEVRPGYDPNSCRGDVDKTAVCCHRKNQVYMLLNVLPILAVPWFWASARRGPWGTSLDRAPANPLWAHRRCWTLIGKCDTHSSQGKEHRTPGSVIRRDSRVVQETQRIKTRKNLGFSREETGEAEHET